MQKGFSLVELSIIVVIIGLLTAGLLSGNSVNRETFSIDKYEDHTAEIDMAIKRFFKAKGFLPCPASGNLEVDTENFGRATDCNEPSVAGAVDTTPTGGTATDTIRIGVVPTRSLGLPDSYMFDKWGSRITYATVKQLAKNASDYDNFSTGLTNGVIEVRDGHDQLLSGGTTDDVTSYILIGHGKDRKGAYTKAGITGIECGLDELDGKNCDNDASFTLSTIEDKVQGTGYYYDLVSFKKKSDMTANASSGSSSTSTSSSTSSSGSGSSGGVYNGGYFVMISQGIDNSYTGDKGGLTGGNAQCLDALTRFEWKFKAEATARGLLDASNVKWFNCDSTTCQMPLPNMTYRMAIAGDSEGVGDGGGADRVNYGGHEIITDDQGRGPGDTLSWTTDETFGNDQGQWISNIKVLAGSSGTMWDTTPKYTSPDKTCNDYTSSDSSEFHSVADWDMVGPGPSGRFEGRQSTTNHYCSSKRAFLCMINP